MKRQIHTTYEWWKANEQCLCPPVDPRHEEALEEHAKERIAEMAKEGYIAGELDAYVRLDDSDGEDGVHYRGSFDHKESEIDE